MEDVDDTATIEADHVYVYSFDVMILFRTLPEMSQTFVDIAKCNPHITPELIALGPTYHCSLHFNIYMEFVVVTRLWLHMRTNIQEKTLVL